MPYLDQGEFYSEFGNYDVKITLPANYVVGATGVVQNESEKAFKAKILNRIIDCLSARNTWNCRLLPLSQVRR